LGVKRNTTFTLGDIDKYSDKLRSSSDKQTFYVYKQRKCNKPAITNRHGS